LYNPTKTVLQIQLQFQPKQWHDKLFVLSWKSDARWVLVCYRNGQSKTWYKRPGRGYRFKRWFVKKGDDQFKNIANVQSPQVVLYFFPYTISWPKRKVVQFDVQHLSIHQNTLTIAEHSMPFHSPEMQSVPLVNNTTHPVCDFKLPQMELIQSELKLANSNFLNTPECDWPANEWSEQINFVNDDDLKNKISQLTQLL
jgi:hypothetical protein